MSDPPPLPREGFSTLGASFTREALDRVRAVVGTLRDQGKGSKEIVELMRKDLPDFPEMTLRRLYDLSTGKKIADDFAKDEVAEQKAVKKDTLDVRLKAARADLVSGSLVRWLGADWYVARLQGERLVLRKIS